VSSESRQGGVPQRLPDELFLVSRAVGGHIASAGPRPIEPTLAAELFASGHSRAADVQTSARETEPRMPSPGAIIDKFRLDALLGVGGFASVYQATHLLLGTTVALKLLRPRPGPRGAALSDALCAEARFAARISHPNVVRVYDATQTPEHTYVVMEYIAGETLEQLIRWRGALPLSAVLRVGLDVAAGLQAGLECQLMHRDIKPRNIIVTPEGRAKVIDLGLAHSRAESIYLPAPRGGGHRNVVGTAGYVAPEWVTAPADVDFRADIYSLGVTLYYAACGSPPFGATDAGACLTVHCDRPIPPPRQFRPDLPEAFVRSLMRMLEKRPALRQQSYRELELELHAILESMHPSSISSATATRRAMESRV
jgi:serine/threonine-protein kinase